MKVEESKCAYEKIQTKYLQKVGKSNEFYRKFVRANCPYQCQLLKFDSQIDIISLLVVKQVIFVCFTPVLSQFCKVLLILSQAKSWA